LIYLFRYVTLTRRDSRGISPPLNEQSSPESSGSTTPIATSPTLPTFPASPTVAPTSQAFQHPVQSFPHPVKPVSNGYITVAQATKMMGVDSLPSDNFNTESDPRAYSKVGVVPTNGQNRVGPVNLANPAALVMSAKDLQVEVRAPYHKVVTTVDGRTSSTKSTMV
jgi:hypothetical protein